MSKICPQCKAILTDDALWCPTCGAPTAFAEIIKNADQISVVTSPLEHPNSNQNTSEPSKVTPEEAKSTTLKSTFSLATKAFWRHSLGMQGKLFCMAIIALLYAFLWETLASILLYPIGRAAMGEGLTGSWAAYNIAIPMLIILFFAVFAYAIDTFILHLSQGKCLRLSELFKDTFGNSRKFAYFFATFLVPTLLTALGKLHELAIEQLVYLPECLRGICSTVMLVLFITLVVWLNLIVVYTPYIIIDQHSVGIFKAYKLSYQLFSRNKSKTFWTLITSYGMMAAWYVIYKLLQIAQGIIVYALGYSKEYLEYIANPNALTFTERLINAFIFFLLLLWARTCFAHLYTQTSHLLTSAQ